MGYQDLIDVPYAHRTTTPDTYFEEELDELEGDSPHSRAAAEGGSLPEGEGTYEPPAEEPPRVPEESRHPVVALPRASRLEGPLWGLPVVVLQSCDSLDEPLLWRIDELGGVAVIGSVTHIHSASGSAMLQAISSRRALPGRHAGRGPAGCAELPALSGGSRWAAAGIKSWPRGGASR